MQKTSSQVELDAADAHSNSTRKPITERQMENKMSEENQAFKQCANDRPLDASLVGLMLKFLRDSNHPAWRQRTERGSTGSENESVQADLPEADVLGDFQRKIRSQWEDTSTELKVGAAALTAFGLGVYIGKRTR